MNVALLQWFLEYVPLVIGVSSVIALYKFTTVRNHAPEVLLFLGLAIFFELLSRYLYYKNVNNLPYLHLYTFLEFFIVGLFYLRTLGEYFEKKLLRWVIGSFLIFAVINAFFIQGITNYNSYARSLECLIIILCSFMYYYKMLNELEVKEPTKNSDFWFNTAFFIYFAGSFVLFILSNLLINQSKEVNLTAWAMHSFLLAILHIFISLGLWRVPPQ